MEIKKWAFIFILIISTLFYSIPVSANSTCIIHALDMNTKRINENQYVVIKIKNNPGITGFKLCFNYDESKIEIIEANRGDVTSDGGFNDNISLKSNSFDIVWSNISDVTCDGSVAILKVRLLTNEPTVINISYSQDDTFNEKWEDVTLTCQPIVTDNYVRNKSGKHSDKTDVVDYTLDERQTEFIISDVLDLMDVTSFDEINNETKDEILHNINKQIAEVYRVQGYFQNFDKLKNSYASALTKSLFEDIEKLQTNKTPKKCIDDALSSEHTNVISIKSVPMIMNYLEKKGLDPVYQKRLSKIDLQKALNSIYQESDRVIVTAADDTHKMLYHDERITKKAIGGLEALYLISGVTILLIIVVSVILCKNIIKKRKAD